MTVTCGECERWSTEYRKMHVCATDYRYLLQEQQDVIESLRNQLEKERRKVAQLECDRQTYMYVGRLQKLLQLKEELTVTSSQEASMEEIKSLCGKGQQSLVSSSGGVVSSSSNPSSSPVSYVHVSVQTSDSVQHQDMVDMAIQASVQVDEQGVQAVAPMTDVGSNCSPVIGQTCSDVGIQALVGEPVEDCVAFASDEGGPRVFPTDVSQVSDADNIDSSCSSGSVGTDRVDYVEGIHHSVGRSASTVVVPSMPMVSGPVIASPCSVVGSEGPVVTSKVAYSRPQVRAAPRMFQQPSFAQHWLAGAAGSRFHRVHPGRVPIRLFHDAAVRCVPKVPTVWVTMVSGWIPLHPGVQAGFFRPGTPSYSPHRGG